MTEHYLETLQLLRRAHRALLDVVDDALNRAGISGITATQALLLHGMAGATLEIGKLYSAGRYHGTNVSYNLRKLVASGFIDQRGCETDRRKACVMLTDKGRKVRDLVEAMFAGHSERLSQLGDVSLDEFGVINRSLKRLDQFWTEQIRYRL